MNRSAKLSVLVALALASSQALALDLGQIQVKSALDRPLVAVIPLHEDYPGEADHLKVDLASAQAFSNAGISRADLKVALSFKVITLASGHKAIRITSTEPVREPYLDFLVQLSWPKGKMLREYTVLLDPLSSSRMAPPAPPPAAANPPVASQRAPAPVPAPPAPAPAAEAPTGSYGPVKYGDTLSHIARANAVDGVSYQQMLIALKSANPNAFFEDNVNALKAGAVLRIPTRQEATEVTRKAAIAAVRAQNRSWQSEHAVAPTMVASSGGSSKSINASGTGAGNGNRLALVPPEAKGAASAGAAGGNSASAQQLRQQLARSQEALSSQTQASADLKSRMQSLEQMQGKNKRLLDLKNAEIAELQNKLSEARKAKGLPALTTASAATIAPAASVANSNRAQILPLEAETAQAASTAGKTAPPMATAKKPVSAHAPAARPATASHSTASVPWYEQLWARIVLAIIIVLLIVWAFLRRRKPTQESARKPAKRSVADHFGDSPMGAAGAAATALDDEHDALTSPLDDDDGEHELLAQLGEHPDNVGLHLELASLYYSRHDVDQFEAAAEAMHAYVDDETLPEWQDVVAMGQELAPDHPLFAAAAYAAHDDAPAPAHEAVDEDAFDFDHGLHAEAADEAAPTEAHGNGYSFDFDLTSSDAADDHVAEATPPPAEPTFTSKSTGLPDESEFDALPPLPAAPEASLADDDAFDMPTAAPVSHELPEGLSSADDADDFAQGGFSDDPVDTKLDLARAYIDMGDHEGARAMLQEALHEGTQSQKDAARKLLDELV